MLAASSTWNSHGRFHRVYSFTPFRATVTFSGRPPMGLHLNDACLSSLSITLTLPWTYSTCFLTWYYFCFLSVYPSDHVNSRKPRHGTLFPFLCLQCWDQQRWVFCLYLLKERGREERTAERMERRKRGRKNGKQKERGRKKETRKKTVLLQSGWSWMLSFHIFKPQHPPG